LVEESLHGFLFAPAAWNELAERLYTLLSDRALRERMGNAGRKKVEAEFEITRAVEPLVARFHPN
jgi:glycosyltransferase involved in cell wall biosynthesis